MNNEIRPEFGNAPECPKGFTPNYKMDAVNEEKRYYRAQWLDERERADALAAHVERLTRLWLDMDDCEAGSDEQMLLMAEMCSAIRDHHNDSTTSLASRDAAQQAAAIDKWSRTIIQMAEWAAKKHNEDPSFPPVNLQLFRELCCDMDDDADRIRRQAKEHRHE